MNEYVLNQVELARNDSLDLYVNGTSVSYRKIGSLATQEGNDALRRDIDELIATPMYTRIGQPYFGNRFALFVGRPLTQAVLNEMITEWKRVTSGDKRIVQGSATVAINEDGSFNMMVTSAITSETLAFSVRR
jgi:phage baseplate assembly protein W